MKNTFLNFAMVYCIFFVNIFVSQELIVYNDIPGRDSSDHYLVRVKFVTEAETEWRTAFVLQTTAKYDGAGNLGNYFDILEGWTASWITFESDFNGDDVIVEISKKNGTDITKAMVRPVGDASAATIINGKAYITFSEKANINVDIDGQLEDNYTGYGYSGDLVHTISIFANPIFEIPDSNDPNVRILQTTEDINSINRDDWQTIIFAPGVHNIGLEFQILDNETLFIPGDAVVHGTIHPLNAWGDASSQFFKVYGSGTLSGENITREIINGVRSTDKKYKPFTYQAEGAHLEGFVVADPAFHTFNMNHSRGGTSNPNIYKNLKILAWRVNSDGINAFRNSIVTDCFFRTQDDAFYLGAENVSQTNNTVWNDANGAVLFLPRATDGSSCTFSDVKVIYHRAQWHWWSGGRIVSFRELQPGDAISNVHIKNILVEDPKPAFPPFYGFIESGTGDFTFNNIIIENVHQQYDGVTTTLPTGRTKPQNTLLGLDESRTFKNILYKNCYFNGKTLTSFTDGNFSTQFVDTNTVVFSESQNSLKIFDGDTDTDWNTATNWSDDTLPTNLDDVIIPYDKNVTFSLNTATEVNDLIINTPGTITIADGGSLKVNGIASSTNVTYLKTPNNTNWQLMSSPVAGVTFDDDFVTANNIAYGSVSSSNRGIGVYNTTTNNWMYLQASASLPTIKGSGYSIKQSTVGNINFTGSVNTTNINVAVSNAGNGFNLIGNPFTTYVDTASFLTGNSSNLETQTIWIWNSTLNNYETKVTVSDYIISPGEGFFVKSSNGTDITFNESYQTVNNTSPKSTKTSVKLNLTDGQQNRFANLYYFPNATKGFDNGYDGETFLGIQNEFDVFTELLENNQNKKYQIQSLPNTDFENLVIPIGIIAETGKELTFTVESLNLPSDLKIYLEDKETKSFIRLDEIGCSYKTTLTNTASPSGRFYLHTKSSVLSTNDTNLSQISIYSVSKNILRVTGLQVDNAILRIYNTLGKEVFNTKFSSKNLVDISLPNIKSGVYLIDLQTKNGKTNKKIHIN